MIPIVGGILLTSVTELSFNIFGFCAALFGCLATSTKTILAESLLHGYKFDRYSLCPCVFFYFIHCHFLFFISSVRVDQVTQNFVIEYRMSQTVLRVMLTGPDELCKRR